MLPLNDTEPNRYSNFPFVTVILILVNVLVMSWEYTLGYEDPERLGVIFQTFGTTPAHIMELQGHAVISSLTATFLHGDLIHLLSNMLALWVFGRRVEDACGSWRFLLFYLTCGAFAHLLSALIHANSELPSIGASGAIFGLMGAYLLLFPGGRIRTLVLVTVVPLWPRLRAFWVVLYLLAVQIIPAYRILQENADFRVGYWAHLGGFFSAAFIIFFIRPEAYLRFTNDKPV
jgi:membrane associated rhomboid family serine protease